MKKKCSHNKPPLVLPETGVKLRNERVSREKREHNDG